MKVLCDNCHKNIASYHQRYIINNLSVEQYLCEDCYRLLKSGVNKKAEAVSQEAVCPYCKTTLSEAQNSSYLGCPNCYKQFRSAVLKNIVSIHTGRRHIGKRIESNPERDSAISEYNRILGLLLQAREEGRAEDAKKYEDLLINTERNDNGK